MIDCRFRGAWWAGPNGSQAGSGPGPRKGESGMEAVIARVSWQAAARDPARRRLPDISAMKRTTTMQGQALLAFHRGTSPDPPSAALWLRALAHRARLALARRAAAWGHGDGASSASLPVERPAGAGLRGHATRSSALRAAGPIGRPWVALALLLPCWAQAEAGPPAPVAELAAPEGVFPDDGPWPVRAEYLAPTDRYPHGILGRVQGWGALMVELRPCGDCEPARPGLRIDLPQDRVFEDLAPRLWDVTGDGGPEVVTVESDAREGARLAVWEAVATGEGASLRLRAATPFIGTRFRWLAPVGAADFTGDGVPEIAYVETPHLGRTLKLVGLRGSRLEEIARLEGVTNHAIGEERIHGGIRHCDGRPEIVVMSGDRADVLAIRYEAGRLVPRVLEPASEGGVREGALGCAG